MMYRALLVDDESWVVESLKTCVDWKGLGFEVAGQASNGLEALELMEKLRPDIVFTDIRMPGMSGLELIKKARDLGYGAEFVFTSGYAEFAYAQKAITYGALGYCLKPFDEAEIAACLARMRQKLGASPTSGPSDAHAKSEPSAGSDHVATISRIIAYVDSNFLSDISIQQISQMFYMNPNYLSQLFKKEMGDYFTEYVTAKRVAHAAALLRGTKLSIHEISEKSGYQDYLYFTRIFKKATGMTPSEYRNSENSPPPVACGRRPPLRGG